MIISHDGEVVMKEVYGSTSKEILYVKPVDQQCLVALRHARQSLLQFLQSIFLPNGYPESVSDDYMAYQIWDTAQAFCSTVTGTLATQEVLRSVGVGNAAATPLAATVTWVLKDGCGHLSKILFAFFYGSSLDAYSKKWRLYADTLNDAAMCVEMALPAFPAVSMPLLCMSTMMKAIVGVAGGATRVAMTRHHALRGNFADVDAKDSAQETAVNLCASFAALAVISLFGQTLPIFGLMVALHIICNYMAVRAVCLRTFNDTRFLQVIDQYIRLQTVATPAEINTREPILLAESGFYTLDRQFCGYKIVMGSSVSNSMTAYPAKKAEELCRVYGKRGYMLLPDYPRRRMYVMIKNDAEVIDPLRAYYHAVTLSVIISAINDTPLCVLKSGSQSALGEACRALRQAQWAREEAPGPPPRHRASADLHRYADALVDRQWSLLEPMLADEGWSLSSNVLGVGEWRVVSQSFKTTEDVPTPSVLRSKSSNDIDMPRERSLANFYIEPTFSVGAAPIIEVPLTMSNTDLDKKIK